MGNKHRLGETPTIKMTLNMDITAKTLYKWKIKDPDGTEFEITEPEAKIENESTGIVYFKVDPTKFSKVGIYAIHVYLEFDSGSTIWITDEPYFHEVYELYK
ncbi:MAG: hypothetical protein ACTSR3_01135 [Candidatus Helarchaeota archaeon]